LKDRRCRKKLEEELTLEDRVKLPMKKLEVEKLVTSSLNPLISKIYLKN